MATSIQRRPIKQSRLQELATAAGLPAKPSIPPVKEDNSEPPHYSDGHLQQARDLLLWRRTWDPEYKRPTFESRSKEKREAVFTSDEVNRALKAAVSERAANLGVIQGLLAIGIDSKGPSVWDKVKSRSGSQKIAWGDLMATAINGRNYDALRLLAARTDQVALNSAVPVALRAQDQTATRIVLERGADLTDFHAYFMEIMSQIGQLGSNGNDTLCDLAELLIISPKPPCHRCRSDALVIAVQNASLRLTSLLVQRGVDADAHGGAALKATIQKRRTDLALAIVSGPSRPSPTLLDEALGQLYASTASDMVFTTKFIEVLLCGGARGDHTAAVLVDVTRKRRLVLLDLLIGSGGSVDYHDGEALRFAVAEKDSELLTRLLRGRPSPMALSKVLHASQKLLLEDLKYAKDTVSKLLSAGLQGDAVHQFLLQAIVAAGQSGVNGTSPNSTLHADAFDLIRMLLDGIHADINAKDAEFLRAAASVGSRDVLDLLISKAPTPASICAAFDTAASKLPPGGNVRDEILRTLLGAGATGPVVDHALDGAVQRGRAAFDEINLLLKSSNLDYDQGIALRHAITAGDLDMLDLLLAKEDRGITVPTLRHVWNCASRLDDFSYQLEVYRRLLAVDTTAAPLTRELVAAISCGSVALPICQLLLDHGANVEAGDGQAVTAAVNAENMDALVMLLAKEPSAPVLRDAAKRAWALEGQIRLDFGLVLLRYGLERAVLDSGLSKAVEEQPCDFEFVQHLLEFGAAADYRDGELLFKAVLNRDARLLEMLVAASHRTDSLDDALDTLLHQTNWYDAPGLVLLRCLLSRGATGPGIDRAFIQSATSNQREATGLLLAHVTSAGMPTAALKAKILQDNRWRSPEGLEVIELLLAHGADTKILRPALVQAAASFNSEAVLLLQNHVRDESTYTLAWGEATLTNNDWFEPRNASVFEILLSSGARPNLSFTLVQLVAASVGDGQLAGLVDILLRYGADVNRYGGQSLRLAAQNGDHEILTLLCRAGASIATLRLALFDVLSCCRLQNNAAAIFACVYALLTCNSPATMDLNSAPEGMDLPLIQVLSKYPGSADLVRLLVTSGAEVSSSAVCPLMLAGPDHWCSSIQPGRRRPAGLMFSENLSALCWALMRPKGEEVWDSCIDVLIELGGMPQRFPSAGRLC